MAQRCEGVGLWTTHEGIRVPCTGLKVQRSDGHELFDHLLCDCEPPCLMLQHDGRQHLDKARLHLSTHQGSGSVPLAQLHSGANTLCEHTNEVRSR